MWPFLEPNNAAAHQISLKSDYIRSWDIVMKPFSKWQSSAILYFQILVFWSRDLCLNVILLLRIKFHVNQTIIRWDIAKKRFSICCKILILCHVTILRTKICSDTPNFMEIRWSAAKIWWWNHFQNGGRPPCWMFENCYFRHVACVRAWFYLYIPNITSIGQLLVQILPKDDFQYGCCPPFWISYFYKSACDRSWNQNLRPNFIEIGWFQAEI